MIGQTISHYRVLGKLGSGGMGVVYEAEDLRLGRHVALKFIPENLVGDKKAVERFEREARAASVLNHPNICTIHEIDDNNGHPFIVMEKLEGESLKQRIRGKPLEMDQLLDVAVQVGDALVASHAKGIIHRDIKPANIYLTPAGQVKVLDFGLAKLARDKQAGVTDDTPLEDSLTAVGVIPGTAVYMSPEQARSEELDPRSDLFSFGVVLYEMATGQKPFHGNNVVTTLDAVLNQKPVSPVTLNPALPHELEGIIGKAMEKDRDQRYDSAATMKSDLQRLKKETESGMTRTGAREISPLRLATNTFKRSTSPYRYLWLMAAGLVLTVLVAVGTWWVKRRAAAANAAGEGTIAVLPLQNMNGDFSVDYLRFALADEISSVLTYARTLDVRPSAITRKYVSADLDPQKVGHELHVANLLTGHYIKEGNHLLVTLEDVEVQSDRVLWQANVNGSSQDLIGLQEQMAKQIRQGLLPALGAASGFLESSSHPKNQAAYDLYLRSVAIPHDPAPNKEAITMLERAVGMDPTYAPAWDALGLRYYYDSDYSNGGEEMFQRSTAAYERALSLDPNRVTAASNLITNQVERGELSKAYIQAQDLVKRRPESADARFALSYVLRYGGMMEEAAKECDTALALDPGDYKLRSCAWVFISLGKTRRAQDFLRLDVGSEWARWVTPHLLLREGNPEAALAAARQTSPNPRFHRDLLIACLQQPRPADFEKILHNEEVSTLTEPDPEDWYHEGTLLAYCGQTDDALRFLKSAVESNYCSYSALLSDPVLAKLRADPRFSEILTAADNCEKAVRNPQAQ
ncbi:MAG TPA: protein kinase [Terriglobales bacterium]|nr:protein kinase [Terriglobales bacterium]